MTLEEENEVVLFATQALLGLISRAVLAVGIEFPSSGNVNLHYWVDGSMDDVREDAEDTVADMEAMFPPGKEKEIRTFIHSGSPQPSWQDRTKRMIYWAKR
jgi:hypothetical protein